MNKFLYVEDLIFWSVKSWVKKRSSSHNFVDGFFEMEFMNEICVERSLRMR